MRHGVMGLIAISMFQLAQAGQVTSGIIRAALGDIASARNHYIGHWRRIALWAAIIVMLPLAFAGPDARSRRKVGRTATVFMIANA